MKRRTFIKSATIASGATLAAPYLLPSGRLFAASGNRLVNHVVFVLFAGGVRNIESVEKSRGNLMPNILSGSEPVTLPGGLSALPGPVGPSLQSRGTLFRNFRYAQGPTGHFNGHNTAVTGNYTLVDLNIKQPPKLPTVFEYYRKHTSPNPSARNCWWISDSLGPYPSLNYSIYPGYGALYGANYLQPGTLISQAGIQAFSNPVQFNNEQNQGIEELKYFLDNNFKQQYNPADAGVENAGSARDEVQQFIRTQLQNAMAGQFQNPWAIPSPMNNDMYNIFAAQKVIEAFQPELLVVNMQGVDICHTNFTEYCNNLRRADYAVGRLWQAIQNTPGMANDTVMIVAPEHGRNLQPNTIVDSFGQLAIDHTSDPTSREIFCLILGPPNVVKQNQVINANTGESIDIVPTIAHVLGFKEAIPNGLLPGRVLNEAFV